MKGKGLRGGLGVPSGLILSLLTKPAQTLLEQK